jgi:hypothetical protein
VQINKPRAGSHQRQVPVARPQARLMGTVTLTSQPTQQSLKVAWQAGLWSGAQPNFISKSVGSQLHKARARRRGDSAGDR